MISTFSNIILELSILDSCTRFAVYEELAATHLRSRNRLMTARGSSSSETRSTHAIPRVFQVAAVWTGSVRVPIASSTEDGRRVPNASLVVQITVIKWIEKPRSCARHCSVQTIINSALKLYYFEGRRLKHQCLWQHWNTSVQGRWMVILCNTSWV